MHRARENQSGKREPEPRPLLANNTIQYSFIDNKQLSIWHIMRGVMRCSNLHEGRKPEKYIVD